ncbi:GMC oxidoreductase [Arenibaculum pallidiluteum]|uniref:GMC oxidoreductase n=1 Tax=Arenibaculum pallidiluteum TaxID=2812559 RepID=UPI001A9655B8|nr:GMC oxidoreductase [Arenibaculum pallidiluteum]
MRFIDVEDAKSRTWDVVIAGTSFAAMFFARGLSDPGSVLFIEKGRMRDHAEQVASRRVGPLESFRKDHRAAHPKIWTAHTMFGGNSNCWWGCTPRFHPDDFRLRTLHGVGTDWPLSYDELEEAYCEVEEVMDIAGGGSDHLLPRSRPFPSPAHAPALSDLLLRAGSRDWFAQPTARSSGTRRPQCCANGVCTLCPIDSKFTILNGLDQFDRDGLHCVTGAELRAIRTEGGTARTALVRTADGREHEIGGQLFALGANAIFNAAILLRSGLSNPHLGAGIHEQASQNAMVDVWQENYYGGTSITGHGYALYPGVDRGEAAAVLLENYNSPPELRSEPGRWTHRLRVKLIAEDLPRPENRVTLADDEPSITWHGHSDYAHAGLARARAKLPGLMPFPVERIRFTELAKTEGHIQGTTRMGRTESEGVVDRNLTTFAVRNLLALGAGAFPTCSPANPTLTLSALSLLAGRALS